MSPSEAIEFAQDLMIEYGLVGWRARLDGAVRRFGCCHFRRKEITLSYELAELNDEATVLDTILHEIAHALAGPRAGHGPHWKHIARSIGCSAERCYSSAPTIQPPANFALRCRNCGHIARRVRAPRRPLACATCCHKFARGRFDERFLLECSSLR